MSNLAPYDVPAQSVTHQEEVKRSVFIAYIAHTPCLKSAKAFVNQIKEKHPDASHNCWAHIAGLPNDSQRYGFSDDGEPSGAAGRPIFNALQGSGLGEVTIVITRYFGGTKLGVGGMARAYGGTAGAALQLVERKSKAVELKISANVSYELVNHVQLLVSEFNATVLNADYAEQVAMDIMIDNRFCDEFIARVFDMSSGEVKFIKPENGTA